ncbi:MAG: transglycosylase domain-containing protein [Clostridiales bacterium]|jgi:penicillin-binding protein 1A|nr:transglycosylase domain-containing protein [Clostridiales bacterium]
MDYSRGANVKSRRQQASPRKKVRNQVGVIVFRVMLAAVLIGGFAALGAGVGLYMGVINSAPALGTLQVQPDIFTSFIYNQAGEETDRLQGDENRVYVTFDKIPQNLKDAFVAIEDERFYSHDGVDFKGMVRAAYTILETRGDEIEGASTITQQLLKNNLMKRSSNTLITKLQEQYLAVQYEKMLEETYQSKERAKDHILEVYANTIALGHDYYGVQTAAWNYFGKEASDLTLSECAVIAAITQNPSKYPPDRWPDNNRERQMLVLDKMRELNMITSSEYNEAVEDPVYDRVLRDQNGKNDEGISIHSYFVDALVTQVSKDLQDKFFIKAAEASNLLYNGGLQIYSTQDDKIQQIMDDVMLDDSYYPELLYELDVEYTLYWRDTVTGESGYAEKKGTVSSQEEVQPLVDGWKKDILKQEYVYSESLFVVPQPQAGMVIIDYHTGQVKAINGGRGEKKANLMFNRAVGSRRQPGSVFKILASYAPAINMGRINQDTIIVDEPFTYNNHQFKNWWGSTYRGPQTVRDGIVQSMNILAVKNMVETGIEDCYQYLKNFGFTTLVDRRVEDDGDIVTDIGPATALGGLTDGVTVLETTAAYGTIANGGEYIKPYLYTKVLNHDGEVILENKPDTKEVLTKGSAYLLTDMMKGVITDPRGTGTYARFQNVEMPIAGKTGTTTDSKDLTFVGYTPYYVAGIWEGYDTPKPMDVKGQHQHFHLDLWRAVMEKVHEGLEYKDFEFPMEDLISVNVCMDSGKLAGDLCRWDSRGSRVKSSYYSKGNEPSEYCDLHETITIDADTAMKANDYCPAGSLKTITGIVVNDQDVTDWSYQIPYSVFHGGTCIYHGPNSVYVPTAEPAQETPAYSPAVDDGWFYGATEQPSVVTDPIASSPPEPATFPPFDELPVQDPWTPEPWTPAPIEIIPYDPFETPLGVPNIEDETPLDVPPVDSPEIMDDSVPVQ